MDVRNGSAGTWGLEKVLREGEAGWKRGGEKNRDRETETYREGG